MNASNPEVFNKKRYGHLNDEDLYYSRNQQLNYSINEGNQKYIDNLKRNKDKQKKNNKLGFFDKILIKFGCGPKEEDEEFY